MRLLDAEMCGGELLLVLRGNPAEMFAAKAAIADILGCGIHLLTQGIVRRIRGRQRKAAETTLLCPRPPYQPVPKDLTMVPKWWFSDSL